MKGFIEVTSSSGRDTMFINIYKIKQVCGHYIFYDTDHDVVKESYDQIKELIKQAE